jgi:hypothetical protein
MADFFNRIGQRRTFTIGNSWPIVVRREGLHPTRSCRPILLKKSERIDSAYTELEKRPIYALQALLAGQADCGESLQPYHLCLSR